MNTLAPIVESEEGSFSRLLIFLGLYGPVRVTAGT